MATQYPYISGAAGLVKTFEQLRKNPPQTIDAAWFKRFGIASANESYAISILRFLKIYDDDGTLVEGNSAFLYGDDGSFETGLEERIRDGYEALFADHGDAAWGEPKDGLARWFRVTDKTSDLTGGRQAATFLNLAALAGHGELPAPGTSGARSAKTTPRVDPPPKKAPAKKAAAPARQVPDGVLADVRGKSLSGGDMGLTVRIEVNLPADGTPESYDAIFASIRKHLIDRG